MLTEVPNEQQLQYAIKINGQTVGYPHQTKLLAEAALIHLPEDVRRHAVIVPITASGNQMLFG
jgi:hypothetical protein